MTDRAQWVVVAAMIALCLATLVAARVRLSTRERIRRREFDRWASAGGFHYNGSRAWNVAERFPGLRLPFGRESCAFPHVFAGEFAGLDGRRRSAWWGELTYAVGSADRIRTVSEAFVVLDLGPLDLPPIEIRPAETGDSLAAAMGLEGLRLESVEFGKRFHVTSADKRGAWDLLDARLMRRLLDAPPGLALATGGPWVAVLRLVGVSAPPAFPFVGPGKGVSIADLEAIRDEARQLLAAFPRTLIPPGDSP